MKDVGKRQLVQRRGGMLWARRKYPDDVVGKTVDGRVLGREFLKSLRVREYSQVDKPLLEAMSEFHRIVDAARGSGKMKAARPGAQRVVDPRAAPALSLDQIRDGDLIPILVPWFARQWGKAPEPARPGREKETADAVEIEASAYLNPRDTGAAATIQPLTEAELARLGYEPDREHPTFLAAADLMARAKAAVLFRDAALIDPSRKGMSHPDDPEVRQLVQAYEARSPRGRGGSRTFGDLLEQFMRDRATKSLSPATRREDQVLHRVIRELVGADTRIGDVTPERCMEIRDLFTRLPRNYRKHYPGRRLLDMPGLAARDRRPLMKRKTANKYIEFLGAVFKFSTKRLKWLAENPAEGLRLNIDRTEDRHYASYAKEELAKLFRAPIFVGCKNGANGAMTRGSIVPRTSVRYWAPLIGLYSGMRSNEICQLDATDIQMKHGLPFFLLSAGGDKRLKTRTSRREVPMHPELVRLGLLQLAEDRSKEGAKKLFADTRSSKTGYFSDPFQKWFRRLLKKLELERDRLSFHSFRGTFKDALVDADVSEPVIEAIAGWGDDRTMVRIYGKRRAFEKKHEAVSKADYGRTTAHLKPYVSGGPKSPRRRPKKPK